MKMNIELEAPEAHLFRGPSKIESAKAKLNKAKLALEKAHLKVQEAQQVIDKAQETVHKTEAFLVKNREIVTDILLKDGFEVRTGHSASDPLFRYVVVHQSRPPLSSIHKDEAGTPVFVTSNGAPFLEEWVLNYAETHDRVLILSCLVWRNDLRKRIVALKGTSPIDSP